MTGSRCLVRRRYPAPLTRTVLFKTVGLSLFYSLLFLTPCVAQQKDQRKGKDPAAAKAKVSGTAQKRSATPAAATPAAGTPAADTAKDQRKDQRSDPLSGKNAEFEREPTYIRSDTLTVKQNESYFVYSGNVEVKKGDLLLTAEIMDGYYDENNQIKGITARKGVVVKKGPSITARGEKAIFDRASDTLTLTESPELQQDGNVLTADKIKIFLSENRSAAEGQVRMKMVKGASTVNVGSLSGSGR